MNEAINQEQRAPWWSTIASHPIVWLLLGLVLTFLSEEPHGVGLLAWFAPVPFLYYLMNTSGWRSRMGLFAALLITMHLTIGKIVTDPIPYAMVPMFAVPLALTGLVVYLTWDWLRRKGGRTVAIFAFPALIVVAELFLFRMSPLGVWGAKANTQLDNLPLLQIVSVFGMTGVAFLIGWGASILAQVFAKDDLPALKRHIGAFVLVLLSVHIYGSLRLGQVQEGRVVTVAAVSTDLILTGVIPSEDELHQNNDQLFQRSSRAAEQGARVIVWNEGATIIMKEEEENFLDRAKEMAVKHGVQLVVAYIVPVTLEPFTFENKYQWIMPNGLIAEEYHKHHPVPGEGAIRGEAPLQVIRTDMGNMAGAICYDYDFPAMSRQHGKLEAVLVVLPSSDWQGIDPVHTRMASLRAIEGGFSLLRSVRAAASAGFDAYGRVRGWLNYYEDNDRILITSLPVQSVDTIYNRIGDALAYLCLLALLAMAIGVIRKPTATTM
ncbi:MAG: nitrilase [Candidatus Marinimicrobia bacterium]|nr:nitrilase [Candidatus Neomarinimicrobiota bacterium]